MDKDDETKAWRLAYKEFCQEHIPEGTTNLQNVFTPYDLCYDMIRKLETYSGGFKDKTFCVFNLEFAEVLCYILGIDKEKIWFVTDCEYKKRFAESERYNGINVKFVEFGSFLKENWDMKFSVVIMNPPYQDANNKRSPLWQKFVKKAMELVKEDGFVAAIHPCSWRKPDHELFDTFKSKKLKYLEIHSQQDGIKTFDCGTRYDWYILQNSKGSNKTVIVDENGIQKEIDISKRFFIPHAHSEVLEKCLAKNEEEKCEIIHSFSMYENRSPWISKTKSAKYKYPCVYATPCNKEPNLLYSCKKDGHFGIKKVIIGKASPENAFYDEDGEYGVTNNCFGIRVDNKVQAMGIIKALSSDKFKEIIEACKWAGFAMEYKSFESFRKDFWKEFV